MKVICRTGLARGGVSHRPRARWPQCRVRTRPPAGRPRDGYNPDGVRHRHAASPPRAGHWGGLPLVESERWGSLAGFCQPCLHMVLHL